MTENKTTIKNRVTVSEDRMKVSDILDDVAIYGKSSSTRGDNTQYNNSMYDYNFNIHEKNALHAPPYNNYAPFIYSSRVVCKVSASEAQRLKQMIDSCLSSMTLRGIYETTRAISAKLQSNNTDSAISDAKNDAISDAKCDKKNDEKSEKESEETTIVISDISDLIKEHFIGSETELLVSMIGVCATVSHAKTLFKAAFFGDIKMFNKVAAIYDEIDHEEIMKRASKIVKIGSTIMLDKVSLATKLMQRHQNIMFPVEQFDKSDIMNTPILLLEFFRMMEAKKNQWRSIRNRIIQHIYVLFYLECCSPPPDELLYSLKRDSVVREHDPTKIEHETTIGRDSDAIAQCSTAKESDPTKTRRITQDDDQIRLNIIASRINRKKELNFLINSGDRMILEWYGQLKAFSGRNCALYKDAVQYYSRKLDDERANKNCVFIMQARILIRLLRGTKVSF